MAGLKELREHRNVILKKITDNQRICKYLHYATENPLSMADILNPFKALFKKRIFPFSFSQKILQDTGANLFFNFTDIGAEGSHFKDVMLRFTILSHVDSLYIVDNNTRSDAICEEIEQMFNQTEGMGIGKVQFYGRRELITDSHAGYILSYKFYEFN